MNGSINLTVSPDLSDLWALVEVVFCAGVVGLAWWGIRAFVKFAERMK